MDNYEFNFAYVIGRFQLPHRAHFALIRKGLEVAQTVLVVLGSAQCARSALNPFNEQERQDMIVCGLTDKERERVKFIAVADYWCNDTWVKAVHAQAGQFRTSKESAVLIGHEKDYSSAYLQTLKLQFRDTGSLANLSSTQLRDMYFLHGHELETFEVLKNYTEPGVVRYLQAYTHTTDYQWLVKDYRATVEYKKRWTAPVYLTADAVVVCNEKILLVQRGSEIGHGQWALPGGFVEPTEDLSTAAVRELFEETQIATSAGLLQAYWVADKTFSHPRRSSRGRLVTNAHLFVLPASRNQPEVQASDDAMDCKWVALDQLHQMRDVLFEDHLHIIDSMLALSETRRLKPSEASQ